MDRVGLLLFGLQWPHLIHQMKFCWEQLRSLGCLSLRLSGNGQRAVHASIPARGGDQ
jgi:hypothetical protein